MARHTYTLHPASDARKPTIDYRAELNDQQFTAVSTVGPEDDLNSGPVLVIAGAGSGKTRTLTYRVAWLVDHGVPPGRILLLTFTNKAAREMLRRVESLLPTDISAIWGGTFHHVANRILRRHASRLDYGSDFTILDREDAVDLLDTCLGAAGAAATEQMFPKAAVLAEIFSLAINTGAELEDLLATQYEYFAHLAVPIRAVQARYAERKRQTNAMDYDDLLTNCLRLFHEHAEIRERYQEQFLHVLVDEYQDTNRVQAEIVDLLAARHRNLMVVGDDAQSIYSWRGADCRNILSFPERYPDARNYKIEVNYRSVPPILELANASIQVNVRQFAKRLEAIRRGGIKPWLVPCHDAHQQAQFVAQRLLELREEGLSLNEIAVLYRAHFHAMELQLELTSRHIPYLITSGLRFFEQAHVKDVSCFLKLAVNPDEELAFKRLAKLLDGVGARTADKLWDHFQPALAAGQPLSLKDTRVPKKATATWGKLGRVLTELRAMPRPVAPADMVERVVDGFYAEYLQTRYPNARNRQEDLRQLGLFARQFDAVEEFLSQMALLTNLEAEDASLLDASLQEYVRLSTIHQAKGQEWRAVFVIGLGEGMFPAARALDARDGEEEERRLFYVAMTRAKDELYLAYPLFRQGAGDSGGFLRPSRFVQELPRTGYQELSLRSPQRNW